MDLIQLQKNKSLKELSTLGIGGLADYYFEATSIESMKQAITTCRSQGLDYLVIGKGSNCLFDDRGFQGAILHNKIDFFKTPSLGLYYVGGGYSFSLLGSQTARADYGGLEFASGIPASVGGAVFMNAGASGAQTCDPLVSVDYIDDEGFFHRLRKEELVFGYRTSTFQQLKGAIVGATFELAPSKDARQKQLEIIRYRLKTQPYKDKSAGCIFRNPNAGHAGKLIEDCGLKNFSIGEAKVSDHHANFLINVGSASHFDFLALMHHIKTTVEEKRNIHLESEVRIVPHTRISR